MAPGCNCVYFKAYRHIPQGGSTVKMSSDNNNSNKDFVEEVKRLRNTRVGQEVVLPILGNGERSPLPGSIGLS